MEQTMTTTTRIHPLMAAAAASVIIVSLTGAAAITGMLPSSRSAPEPQAAMTPAGMPLAAPLANGQLQAATQTLYANGQLPPAAQAQYAAPAAAPMVVSAAPGTTTYIQSASNPAAPVVIVKQEPAPVVKQAVVQKPRVVERIVERRVVEHRPARQVNHYEPAYRQAPAPAQPNYVGIGTGAVIGGLIGNQVGGGNGKKLATLAGIIGGGYIGNEVANRNSR
jgi:uncharacterized protein YcfJ